MRTLFIILSLCLISCHGYTPKRLEMPPSERTRYYDNKGRYQGYSIKSSTGVTRYYDKKGRYKGRSEWYFLHARNVL
jgi:hypothetical protein